MSKVLENTGKKLHICSDNGLFMMVAVRRAIMEEYGGETRYYGSKWYIQTHQRKGAGFAPFKFSGLRYVVGKKQEIIDMLSKSVQFKQAYAELVSR